MSNPMLTKEAAAIVTLHRQNTHLTRRVRKLEAELAYWKEMALRYNRDATPSSYKKARWLKEVKVND